MHCSSRLSRYLGGSFALVAAGLLADSAHACLNTNTLEPCQCIEKMLMASVSGPPRVTTPSLSGGVSSLAVKPAAASIDLFAGDFGGKNYYSQSPGDSSGMGNITVTSGDTITWTIDAGNKSWHSITSLPNAPEQFDSGILSSGGDSFTQTFTTPGEYGYYCENHSTVQIINGVVVTHGTQVGFITVVAAPEPGAASILGIAALFGLVQRRRKMTSPHV